MAQLAGPMRVYQFTCWIIEPYGACTRSSECNCIQNYYRLESLVSFGTGICGGTASRAI